MTHRNSLVTGSVGRVARNGRSTFSLISVIASLLGHASLAAAAPSTTDPTVVTQAPTLEHFERAVLSPEAPPIQRLTTVSVELTIREDGTVTDVALIEGVGQPLDDAAMEAIRHFRFKPAEIAGKPTAVRIRYEYVYEPDPQVTTLSDERAAPPSVAQPSVARATEVGKLEGRILERGRRRPVPGATVRLPELGREALTDAAGRFSFADVPPGTLQITVVDPEHQSLSETEAVAARHVTEVTYYVAPSGLGSDDLLVVGKREKKLVTQREISPREVETLPGSNGDPIRAVQNVPGVARTTGDQLIFRGERGGRILVNGLPIPLAYHFGLNLRSTVQPALIGSLSLTPGNYDVSHGGTNAGIVEIATRRPANDGLHAIADVGVFDAALLLESPVGEHAAVALSLRRSYIDGVLAIALNDEDKKMMVAAPRYYDYQGLYDWKVGRDRIRVNVFGSSDKMIALVEEPNETDPAVRGKIMNAERWVTGQLLWDRQVNDATSLTSGIALLYDHGVGSLGTTAKGIYTSRRVSLRSELKHRTASWLSARAGLDAHAELATMQATIPRVGNDGAVPVVFAAYPSVTGKFEEPRYNPALYALLEGQLGRVRLAPGVRVEHFSRPGEFAGTTLVQPRLDAGWSVSGRTQLRAAAGLYSRYPDIWEYADVAGNPRLLPERSWQFSAGVTERLTDSLSFDVVGFYHHLYRQVSTVNDRTVNYDNRGKGRSYGTEMLLKQDSRGRLYGWVAYTLSRSERMESGERRYHLYAFDQTHHLNVAGQYRLSASWEIGARFRYVSGNPVTPVVDARYDSDADVYVPVHGAPNSERMGAFHQLDLRIDRHWLFDTWKLTAYLDLQNVYARKNPGARSYNYDYSKSKAVADPLSIPFFFPSFGVKGEL